MTPEEMEARLPELCFVLIPEAEPGHFVMAIRRGESGCYPTTYDCQTVEEAKIVVDHMNRKLGVTELQAQCMHAGSMFGWDKPGADPEAMRMFLPIPKEELMRRRLDEFLFQEVVPAGGSAEIYEAVMAALQRRGKVSLSDLRALTPSGDVAAEHLAKFGLLVREVEEIRADGRQGSCTWFAMPDQAAAAPPILMGSRYPLFEPSLWDDEYGSGYGFVEPAHDADRETKGIRCYVVNAEGKRHAGFWNELPTVVMQDMADWSRPVRQADLAAAAAPAPRKRSSSLSM